MSRTKWSDDKILSRLITNKTDRTRWDNIAVLRKRPSEYLFSKCVELTRSLDPKVRKIGYDILAQFGVTPRPFLEQSLKLFFKSLRSEKDPDVVMSILFAISHNNSDLSESQILQLCALVKWDNEFIKEGLVSALLGIDHPEALKVMIHLSSDPLNHIRDWATFGLGTLLDRNNRDIREALWIRVNDKHQDTKLEAILGLARRKDKRVKEIIIRELLRGEFGNIFFEAIVELGDQDLIPNLKEALKKAEDENVEKEWIDDLRKCLKNLKVLSEMK